ncbi:M23 family metallopeptidase [Aquimarina sp. 2201CG5-10]|uniref:M23 family metallopeptidase n=1 Tax=Aquimarina callyspongiae TaxID=3098150 RepID=UPI002AB57127|nr:M23 family metallopeptidase [Aquimarina sp. 2201CG5-10]MDY8138548.1 M23 family metallopeptidase [Aquimarina sp. 2201CG5-10]
MKKITILFLCFYSIAIFSQDNFKIYYEHTDTGFVILADNDEFCPVSAEINFNLENLESSKGNNKIFVIPAQKKKHIITNLTVVDRKKRMKLGFNTSYNFGDHTLNKYEDDFGYYLPFEKGKTYWLSQGYDGATSHKGENALDFKMPMSSKIYTARDGVVIDVEDSYSRSCTDAECAKFNNFIVVYHSDGTFAEYTHIKQEGAKVKIGDQVKIGQFIGYSGNVGWATGPHLHFIVFFQRIKDRETLKTKFLVDKGNKAMELIEKEQYTRMY